jgi:hypothetical protein
VPLPSVNRDMPRLGPTRPSHQLEVIGWHLGKDVLHLSSAHRLLKGCHHSPHAFVRVIRRNAFPLGDPLDEVSGGEGLRLSNGTPEGHPKLAWKLSREIGCLSRVEPLAQYGERRGRRGLRFGPRDLGTLGDRLDELVLFHSPPVARGLRAALVDPLAPAAPDLDLPRLSPLRHGEHQGQNPVVIARGDVLGIDRRPETELAAEATLRSLGD